jgi:hypothetical protein
LLLLNPKSKKGNQEKKLVALNYFSDTYLASVDPYLADRLYKFKHYKNEIL